MTRRQWENLSFGILYVVFMLLCALAFYAMKPNPVH